MKSTNREFILCLAVAGLFQTAQAEKVALQQAPLASPAMVLSPVACNFAETQRPIVYYRNEGEEVFLPRQSVTVSDKTPAQKLTLAGVACELALKSGRISLTAGGQTRELQDFELGYRSVDIGAKSGPIAFSRGFVFENEARIFYRSTAAMAGTVDGLSLRLFDDDLNGRYEIGKDAISLSDSGTSAIFGQLSSLLPGAKCAWEVKAVAEDGSSITLEKYTGAIGALKFETTKDLECRLALVSEDGKCSFGVLATGQTLTLPAGKYRLSCGFVYRPSAKHVVGLILPAKDFRITVPNGGTAALVIGDAAAAELPWGEGSVSMDFQHYLALDLSPAEAAYNAGDVAKARKLFDDAVGARKSGPAYEATQVWIDDLNQRLTFEASPEGAALREAEAKVLAAVKAGKLEDVRATLPAAQAVLARIPASIAKGWLGFVCKAKVESWGRFAAGTSCPGVKLPKSKLGGQFRDRALQVAKVTAVPGDPEYAANIDWTTKGLTGGYSEFSKFSGRSWIYEGFLIVPQGGEYELALESGTGGALLQLDGKTAIDHWGFHVPEERSVRMKLSAGRHPIHLEMFTVGGHQHDLHFRWTPPGGRETLVPTWAFEYEKNDKTPAAGEK